jgi:hypothetical protein
MPVKFCDECEHLNRGHGTNDGIPCKTTACFKNKMTIGVDTGSVKRPAWCPLDKKDAS